MTERTTSMKTMRIERWLLVTAVAAAFATAPAAGFGQEPPVPAAPMGSEETIAALRAELEALRQEYAARLEALEERLSEVETAAPQVAEIPPAPPPPAAPARTSNYFNPAVAMIGNFVATGGHDPGEEDAASTELSESEMSLQAVVDPYARADFFLAFGEEGVEVEEGYATFTALPADLLLKAGRMRVAFGKTNPLHFHTLPWVDQPLPVVNLLGGEEGWIGTGLSLAKLIPLPADTFSEATLQVFRGEAEGLFAGEERGDLAINARYRLFRDLTEATNLDFGLSLGRGPNGLAPGGDTELQGFDATLRWKPLRTAMYRSFILRGEAIRSRQDQPGGLTESALGWYAAGDVQLARRWLLGGRYESAERAEDDELRDTGEALVLTFWPSEFSQLRAEGRRRRFADGLTATELLLQLQFSIGAHGAHTF